MEDKVCKDCGSNDLIFVKYVFKNGAVNIRKQCQNCGSLLIKNYPKKNFFLSELDFVDKKAVENFKKKKNELSKIKKSLSEYRNNYQRKKWDYYRNTYLKSDEWKHKRSLIMNNYNWQCQNCKSKATDLHHLTYENMFCEKFEDLKPLCRSCHEKEHNAI